MSEEEEKLIEALELEIQRLEKIATGPTGTYAPFETLVMILNLIKSQQEKIEKKDKIIDLMARSWKQDDIRSVEEIIKDFEKKVEESNEN